jgi:hypothetical protein
MIKVLSKYQATVQESSHRERSEDDNSRLNSERGEREGGARPSDSESRHEADVGAVA